jgi:alpha-L-fucosidase-like protein
MTLYPPPKLLIPLLAFGWVLATGPRASAGARADWLKDARYGIMVHFLPEGPGWEKAVDDFDVAAFADDARAAGAKYVLFTLGQNSGYYCSPNTTYERLAGYHQHERCSRRDLPLDLADALSKRGVRLMLYLPSRSPQQDRKAMAGLSDVGEWEPAPQEFTRKWSEVIREWSVRYGRRVSGWWFDGAYNTRGWDDLSRPQSWKTWAAAARAGNPDSVLAFNPGLNWRRGQARVKETVAFRRLCDEQDYTAGEQENWGATPKEDPAPAGVQWHGFSYLGSNWGQTDGPKLSDEQMVAYLRTVNAEGGAVTIDVGLGRHLDDAGKVHVICKNHLAQLKALAKANGRP